MNYMKRAEELMAECEDGDEIQEVIAACLESQGEAAEALKDHIKRLDKMVDEDDDDATVSVLEQIDALQEILYQLEENS